MSYIIDKPIFQYLSTNGDGTGTVNANGNYSGAGLGATEFYFEATGACEIHRMLVYMQDTGAMDAEGYGNGAALTNGFSVKLISNGQQENDLTAGQPIKQNGHWARQCYDAVPQSYGVGDEYIAVRWTFSKSGAPFKMSKGEKISITFNDDLTRLVDHSFLIQGKFV